MSRLTFRVERLQGRQVHVAEAHGDGATPVVFVHGFACTPSGADRRTLEAVFSDPEVRRRAGRVIALHLPGFGRTDPLPIEQTSIDGYADWYVEVLDALGMREPFVLFGESLGGAVACVITTRHPERVRSLFVMNSIGGAMPRRHRIRWILGVASMAWPPLNALPQYGSSLKDALATLRHPKQMWRISADLMSTNLALELPEIRNSGVPVTVVFSDDDPLALKISSQTFVDTLDVEPFFIPGDHRSFIENHPVIVETLRTMLVSADEDPI